MKPVISVLGLGYVGLPLAVAFSKHYRVIGFDIKTSRVAELQAGLDRTGEVTSDVLHNKNLSLHSDPEALEGANFHIVTVPTPIDSAKKPNISNLIKASETIGQYLQKNHTVVYESTVYPGLTEEDCLPILECISGLKAGQDFKLGYSPERINPGDKEHTLEKITKVVSGLTSENLEYISSIYGKVISVGLYQAPSIKIAEAAKVLENTQRDLNVALMNELAIICHRMQIDTSEVLKAAGSKWNFLPFKPGLVGGHCIGVDPYYLTYKAEQLGYHPDVILAGRRINDQMGSYIANQIICTMIQEEIPLKNAQVGVLGVTFKENCPDIRNSKVIDIIEAFNRLGIQTHLHDPLANKREVFEEYGIELLDWNQIPACNALVMAVGHEQYRLLPYEAYAQKLTPDGIVADIKGVLDSNCKLKIWRL
ncbi:MAG: nucleotide sugar dehydrogenase [Deltaproteobacteria bacterium]|nr:nucleotide sugar dehydrogenase [Deltaproteobacteria bacterium]